MEDIDGTMGEFVSGQMCSKNCPCSSKDFPDAAKEWIDMSESDLNQFGRTKESTSESLIPLDFRYVDQTEKTYDKFNDCYEAIRNGDTSAPSDVKDAYEKIANDPSFQTGI